MNSVLAAKRGAENKVSLGLIYLSCSSPQDHHPAGPTGSHAYWLIITFKVPVVISMISISEPSRVVSTRGFFWWFENRQIFSSRRRSSLTRSRCELATVGGYQLTTPNMSQHCLWQLETCLKLLNSNWIPSLNYHLSGSKRAYIHTFTPEVALTKHFPSPDVFFLINNERKIWSPSVILTSCNSHSCPLGGRCVEFKSFWLESYLDVKFVFELIHCKTSWQQRLLWNFF